MSEDRYERGARMVKEVVDGADRPPRDRCLALMYNGGKNKL